MQRTLRFWTSSPSGDQATARTAWWIPRIPEFPKFSFSLFLRFSKIFSVPLLGDGLDGLDLVILSVLVPLNGLYAPLRCSSAFDLKESMLIELKHMFLGQGKGQFITILTSLSLIFQREIISHELSRF